MKILVTRFSWQPQNIGGAEISADQHAIELAKLGHEVRLITNYREARPFTARTHLPLPGYRHAQNILAFILLPLLALYYRPDIINAHSRSDQVALSLTKPLHRSLVVWKDAGDLRHQIKRRSNVLARLNQWSLFRALKKSDAVYTLNNEDQDYLIATISNLYSYDIGPKISVIPSDISFNDYDVSTRALKKPEHKMVLGFVGRLEDVHKGLSNLIRSLEKLENQSVELWVVGGGDQKNFRELANKTNVEVRFFGLQKDVSKYYRSFDIVVVPSKFEGWGKVVKESMYFSLPTIGTNTGGIAQQIDHLQNGFLISDNSPQSIAVAIDTLISNPRLIKKLALSAKNKVIAAGDFTDLVTKRVEPLLKESYRTSRKILIFYPKLKKQHKTGVAYYVDSLSNALSQQGVHPTCSSGIQDIALIDKIVLKIASSGLPVFRRLLVGSYHAVIYPNFYHHVDPVRSAVVVHDLAFLKLPEYLPSSRPKIIEKVWPTNSTFLKRVVPKSMSRSDVVVAVSQTVKKEIVAEYNVPSSKIVVTPIPPDQRFKPSKSPRDDNFIYFQATIEPRKNHINLLRAYEQLPKSLSSKYRLVLGGGKGWRSSDVYQKIEEMRSLGFNIDTPGYVSEKELLNLYRTASVYIQPSHYEGFGMPLLEAMACGTLVLASDIPVFNEVAAGAAIYFDKDSPADIAAKIEQALNLTASKKKQLIEKGYNRATHYRSDMSGAQELLHRLVQDI